jgi:hypothetical protein
MLSPAEKQEGEEDEESPPKKRACSRQTVPLYGSKRGEGVFDVTHVR